MRGSQATPRASRAGRAKPPGTGTHLMAAVPFRFILYAFPSRLSIRKCQALGCGLSTQNAHLQATVETGTISVRRGQGQDSVQFPEPRLGADSPPN